MALKSGKMKKAKRKNEKNTCSDQNASGWHFATSVVERAIRQLIIGISDRTGASWPSEPTRDA